MGKEEQPSIKEMLEHAWRYFALHANQRLLLFNFFIVISASVTAGLAACLQKGGLFDIMGTGLGLLLTLVSFIFWKLDQRTSFLIKHGEASIIELEEALPISAAKLLTREPGSTVARRKGFLLSRMWTYGTAFRVVFLTMSFVGVNGAVVSCIRYLTYA